jgi:signal transduction histidine kinase
MMFSSLRSRLWLSYALVTAAALAVVAVILVFYIIQNPSTYRQANARLTVVAAFLRKNEPEWVSQPGPDVKARFQQVDGAYSTRIILFDANRQVEIDSQSATQPAIPFPRLPRLRPYSILRDAGGNYWIYILRHLGDGRWLLLAVVRPAVPFITILSDELFLPVLGSGVVALIISLLLAFWLARWIGDPLQKVVVASQGMPAEEAIAILPHGPHEVKELTRAFNEMNQRVHTSQASQRDFVSNVSHELKTPLTSVQGFAQAILDGTAATPKSQRQAAQVIYDESARMHRMVLDLLDLARMDAGTFDLQLGEVDIPLLLGGIVEKFTPQARLARLHIRLESAPLPPVLGDGDRLAQVFTNLLDNAIQFTPAGGSITLRTEQTTNGIRVDVTDSGVGMPPEVLPKIFDRFFQADPSRSGGRKHGSGLGLAIVSEIVQTHGGRITVRSEPGTGSTFTVSLPFEAAAEKTVSPRLKR